MYSEVPISSAERAGGSEPQPVCRKCSFRPDAAGTLREPASASAAVPPSPLEGEGRGEGCAVLISAAERAGWIAHLERLAFAVLEAHRRPLCTEPSSPLSPRPLSWGRGPG